jgi:hypothetical protein
MKMDDATLWAAVHARAYQKRYPQFVFDPKQVYNDIVTGKYDMHIPELDQE